ncbi:MAG: amidohydrolase family protein [Phycisphaerales bacterium]|nr:amidohydrolase family protein [Phycisphaerales bacterium]
MSPDHASSPPDPGPASGRLFRLDAAGIADAVGVEAAPGSILIQVAPAPSVEQGFGLSLVAAGSPATINNHPAAASAHRIDLGSSVVLPALVNAHTHLDLTHIGPRPFDPGQGFIGWIEIIRNQRHADPTAIAESVREGIRLSRLGGIAAIGDIAGCPSTGPSDAAPRALQQSHLSGTSFIEFFAMGRHRQRSLERAMTCLNSVLRQSPDSSPLAIGLQPHATNTIALDIYEQVLAISGMPVSTHLAETPEEHEFITSARGPQREFLEHIGIWNDQIIEFIGKGLSPVAHLARALDQDVVRWRAAPIVLAHVNDCSDEDLDTLARLRLSGIDLHIAYCPRASEYFRAHEHFGPHRYRDMLARGIPVALGTDSIVNLPPETLTTGISTLDEMRRLFARDGGDPGILLAMATVNAAGALGMERWRFSLSCPGPIAGLLAIPVSNPVKSPGVITAALMTDERPQFLSGGNEYRLTGT